MTKTTSKPVAGISRRKVQNRADAGQPSGGGKSTADLVRKSNLWRDNYNPLRALTIARVMAIFEAAERGAFPELQLTMRKVEKRFPVYKALRQRRLSAIQKLDWDVKTAEKLPPGCTQAQADAQAEYLKSRYNLITNLREAFGQIALAEFRGYTVLQKHRYTEGGNDGAVEKFYWLEPWCFARDGFYGDFYYNETSKLGVGLGSCQSVLGEANRIGGEQLPRTEFIIREVESPLYEIALIAFINWLMGRKDQAAFVEIFGLPNAVVIMPPNIPGGKEDEYQAAAEKVADGVSGALPNGADVKFPGASQRGEDPFEKFCGAQEKDVVLAGTGGLLTMLSMPQGLGAGSTDAHSAAFDEIAQADALKISEVLQRDFDQVELAAQFPGQPVLAYFELSPKDTTDVAAVVTDVQKLASSGYKAEREWLAEKTGYKFEEADEVQPPVSDPENPELQPEPEPAPKKPVITNRAGTEQATDLAETLHDMLLPLLKRLEAIANVDDAAIQQHMIEKLLKDFPQIADAIKADDSLAKKLNPQLSQALIAGLTEKPVMNRSLRMNTGKILNVGDLPGHDFRGNGSTGGIPEGEAPKRYTVQEADALLTKGVEEKDTDGRLIKFGVRYKEHTEAHNNPDDVRDRKERLSWSQETVRTGKRFEYKDPNSGKNHSAYAKFFSEKGKSKGFVSLVDVHDGEAFSGFRSPRHYIEKLGTKNREVKDESGEQPPLAMLQAIAAAGRLQPHLQSNPEPKPVNL
ncbi:MAG: DUF935 family protein [Verrucomicrobiota bacterium]